MDPNATLRLFLSALDDNDLEAALEHRENLRNWLDVGGFMPTLTKPQLLEIMKYAAEDLRR